MNRNKQTGIVWTNGSQLRYLAGDSKQNNESEISENKKVNITKTKGN